VRALEPPQMTKTLAHELAHHFAEADRSSPEEETVAESVTYVVCAHYGLDTGARSFPAVLTFSPSPLSWKPFSKPWLASFMGRQERAGLMDSWPEI
jgi:hypothetical protein